VSGIWTAWRAATAEASGSVCGRAPRPFHTGGQGGHTGRTATKRTARGGGRGQREQRFRARVRTPAWSRAGHRSSGQQWFRKQRTVNPLLASARYNFHYSFSRPARRAAAVGGRPRAGSATTAVTGEPASLYG
jgi:hypothetical protein